MGFTGYMDMGALQLDSVDGLKKASQHFLDKSKIIVAMLNYLADRIDSRLSNTITSSDPEENFKALFYEQVSF